MKESLRASPSTPPIWDSTSVYHIRCNANCFLSPTHPYEKLESKTGDTFLMQPAGVIIMVSQSEAIFFLVSLVETSVSCSNQVQTQFHTSWRPYFIQSTVYSPFSVNQKQSIFYWTSWIQVYPLWTCRSKPIFIWRHGQEGAEYEHK